MVNPVHLFRTTDGPVVAVGGKHYRVPARSWDDLFVDPDLAARLRGAAIPDLEAVAPDLRAILPPLEGQEVWAAGVTYFRSRAARVDESRDSGGAGFYDRVYEAARPELFFKATANRVSGTGQDVRIRSDSRWTVPEPELGVALTPEGRVAGYTIGNDMSARDIEGENPLYLPQAKIYDGSCGLGPAILVTDVPLPHETEVRMTIDRAGETVFDGGTTLSAMKRPVGELVEYLFRDNTFPSGCILLTGTGVVPPDDVSLEAGDRIRITIEPVGTLEQGVIRFGEAVR